MSEQPVYVTKEGLQKLRDDLQHLRTKGRAKMAAAIAEAREKGDLSENAEYDAAKEEQGHLEARIAKLENTIANARVVDEKDVDTSTVRILSKVTIKNSATKGKQTYTLVSPHEADMKSGKLSVSSPIGKGLLGKAVGEKVEIKVPAGRVTFEVVDITR
jgi:transcription elongation factor GreA